MPQSKKSHIPGTKALSYLGFGVVLLLTLTTIFLLLFEMQRWQQDMFMLVTDSGVDSELAITMRDSIRMRAITQQRMLNAANDAELEDEYMLYHTYAARYAEARYQLVNRVTDDKIRNILARLDQATARAQPLNDEAVEELLLGTEDLAAIRSHLRKGNEAQDAALEILDELATAQQEKYKAALAEFSDKRKTVWIWIGVVFGLSLVIAIIVTRILSARHYSLRQLSIMDSLTHVPNRRHFNLTLQREWNRCARLETPLSLIMLDVDFFKDYNDRFGHLLGDACLADVASILDTQLSRASDFLARYGGEEFAIILPNTDREEALATARRLCQAVEDAHIPAARPDASQWLTASAGTATCIPTLKLDIRNLVNEADHYLYQAKEAGRNRAYGSAPAPKKARDWVSASAV